MPKQFNISDSKTTYLLLGIIILVGSILRCWNLFEIPFTYDEMSAFLRTGFTDFDELIEVGVKTDTHPPGVQIFMNYWIMVFGDKEWIVKLPFILMGIGCIPLTFSIGKKWSNDTTGLLSASFIAVLQFPVMYSQIARPYITGMFLILLFTLLWTILMQREQWSWKIYFYLCITGALCGYTHHFSLLAAGIIGLSGIFICNKKHRLKYLLVIPLTALLYAPNLAIFFHQLNRGGIGEWLGKPQSSFLLDFFKYAFHHSYWMFTCILTLFIVEVFSRCKSSQFNSYNLMGLLWFISVFAIGFLYSVFRNPVLQFSMMIFCFPFIFTFLFQGFTQQSKSIISFSVLLILVVGSFSLVYERNHFEIFYHNRYHQMKDDALKLDESDTEIVFINYDKIVNHDYPTKHQELPNHFTWNDSDNDFNELVDLLHHSNKKELTLGYMEQFSKDILATAFNYFPNLKKVSHYHGASTYYLSKDSIETNNSYLSYNLDLNNLDTTLENVVMNFHPESFYNWQGKYIENNEWSLGLRVELKDILQHKHDWISCYVSYENLESDSSEILLVAVVRDEESEEVHWSAANSNYFQTDKSLKKVICHGFEVNQFFEEQKLTLEVFIWNTQSKKILIENIGINVIEGNRNKYSWFEPIVRN